MEQVQQSEVPYDQWVTGFSELLARRERYYTVEAPESMIKGVFAGFARESLTDPNFEYFVKVMHEAHPTIEPPVAFNLLLRAIQDDRMAHDPDYPNGYDAKERWKQGFEDLVDDGLRDGMLEFNLRQHLLSNVAERYKTIPLFINLMRERFGEHPAILDVGCSQLHGGKKLVFRDELGPKYGPFDRLEILDTTNENRQVNRTLSNLANVAIRQQVEYGAVVGLDIRDIDDPATKRFARSCRFYPEELKVPSKVAEYDLLESLDPHHERVNFYNYNFSDNAETRQFRQVSPVKQYDIIMFSTVFYQVAPQERAAMLVNAANMLTNDGIIIIQDAAEKDFDKPYSYVTSLIDGRYPERGEQPILRWATGRCLRAIPEVGRVAFNGREAQTIEQAIPEIIRPEVT